MSYRDTLVAAGFTNYVTLDETAGVFAASIGNRTFAATTAASGSTLARGSAALLLDGGKSVTFGGTGGDYLSTAAVAVSTADFVIALWVKTTSNGIMVLVHSEGDFYFYLQGGKVSVYAGGEGLDTDSSHTVNDGQAHLIVLTRVSGVLSIYIDGSGTAAATRSSSAGYNFSNALYLGDFAPSQGSHYPYNGVLDSFGWSGVSGITPSQVANLYTAGTTVSGSPGLTLSPSSATTTPGGAAISLTAIRTNSAAALAATLAGAGTLSTTAPTSGVAFTYTPPSTGNGSYTVTVTDATDGLSVACMITCASSPLAGLTLAQGTATHDSISFLFSGINGGKTGYQTKLYRGQTAGLAIGSKTLVGSTVAGASGTLADPSPPDGTSYYTAVTTDADGSTVASAEVPAARLGSSLAVGFGGDSITALGLPGYEAPIFLSTYGPRAINFVNRGVSNTTSSDWAQSITQGPTNGADLPGSVVAWKAANCAWVSFMIGTNNSKFTVATTPDVYEADLLAIAAYVNGQGLGILFHASPFIDLTISGVSTLWNSASLNLLTLYRGKLTKIDNGTTIRCGDLLAFDYFANNRERLQDGVHPNGNTGQQSLAALQMPHVALVVGLAPANPTPPDDGGGTGSGPSLDDIRSTMVEVIASTPVKLDLGQSLADTTAGTVGGALHGAWATAWGRVVLDPVARLLAVYGAFSQTAAARTFMVNRSDAPTSKTPLP